MSETATVFGSGFRELSLPVLQLPSLPVLQDNSIAVELDLHDRIVKLNVTELTRTENIFVLDTRKHYEYEVSHIKNAIHVGYEKFDLKTTQQKIPNKNSKIVLYCSLGIRSEDIGEQLKKAGYTNVYNLYGGIFEWKNKDQVVYDSIENRTEKVHTFDKNWSKWLLKGEKIYE